MLPLKKTFSIKRKKSTHPYFYFYVGCFLLGKRMEKRGEKEETDQLLGIGAAEEKIEAERGEGRWRYRQRSKEKGTDREQN